ncbi:TetR/AcrR family transcriptional regulator [Pseudonocardia sp. CA-107938]|uniref:TetR/AcrR family transcriptional regulator n=1 Tax=Pseudonocardia sp. CA-107938 TaxID=3240021 RepID=UPI003D8C1B33
MTRSAPGNRRNDGVGGASGTMAGDRQQEEWSVSPQARSTVDQGRATRKAILQAAVELFGEHGYRGCSLAQIAARAGIGQSGVLHHFGSKERLLVDVLQELYPADRQRPEADAVAGGELSFPDLLDATARRNSENPAVVRFFSVLSAESLTAGHPAQQFFVERYDTIRELFAEAVTGDVPDARTKLLVGVAFAAMDGLQTQWLRNPAEVDLVGSMRVITDLLRAELGR